jgi:hypothetical protein
MVPPSRRPISLVGFVCLLAALVVTLIVIIHAVVA